MINETMEKCSSLSPKTLIHDHIRAKLVKFLIEHTKTQTSTHTYFPLWSVAIKRIGILQSFHTENKWKWCL